MRRRVVIDYSSQNWNDEAAFREFDAFFVAEHQSIREHIFHTSKSFSEKLNFGVSQNIIVSKLLFVISLSLWVKKFNGNQVCFVNVPRSLVPTLEANGFEVEGVLSDYWIRRLTDLKNITRCLLLICQIALIKVLVKREIFDKTRIFIDRFILSGNFESDRFYTGINEIAVDDPSIRFFLNIKIYSPRQLLTLINFKKRYFFVFKEKYVSLKTPIQSLISFYSKRYKNIDVDEDPFQCLCRYFIYHETLAHFYYESDLNDALVAKIHLPESANFFIWWEAQLPSYQLVESLSRNHFKGSVNLYVGFFPRSRDFHLVPLGSHLKIQRVKPKLMVIGPSSERFFESFLQKDQISRGPAFRFLNWLDPQVEKCDIKNIGGDLRVEGPKFLKVHFVSGVDKYETEHILKSLKDIGTHCAGIQVTVELHPALRLKNELSTHFRKAILTDLDKKVIVFCGGTSLATYYACTGYKVINFTPTQGFGGSVIQGSLDSIEVVNKISIKYFYKLYAERSVGRRRRYSDCISQHIFKNQRELVHKYFKLTQP